MQVGYLLEAGAATENRVGGLTQKRALSQILKGTSPYLNTPLISATSFFDVGWICRIHWKNI